VGQPRLMADAGELLVTLLPQHWHFRVRPGETVLEAALRAGIRLPHSCRNGTCRACLCDGLQGEVRYRVEWPGLSAEERAGAHTLPCVAVPQGDVALHAPRAVRC